LINQLYIQQVSIDGRDIQRIVFDRLAPALEGEDLAPSVFSLIMFSIMLMKPDIDMESLQEAVQSTSEHIIMALTPAAEDGLAN